MSAVDELAKSLKRSVEAWERLGAAARAWSQGVRTSARGGGMDRAQQEIRRAEVRRSIEKKNARVLRRAPTPPTPPRPAPVPVPPVVRPPAYLAECVARVERRPTPPPPPLPRPPAKGRVWKSSCKERCGDTGHPCMVPAPHPGQAHGDARGPFARLAVPGQTHFIRDEALETAGQRRLPSGDPESMGAAKSSAQQRREQRAREAEQQRASVARRKAAEAAPAPSSPAETGGGNPSTLTSPTSAPASASESLDSSCEGGAP